MTSRFDLEPLLAAAAVAIKNVLGDQGAVDGEITGEGEFEFSLYWWLPSPPPADDLAALLRQLGYVRIFIRWTLVDDENEIAAARFRSGAAHLTLACIHRDIDRAQREIARRVAESRGETDDQPF